MKINIQRIETELAKRGMAKQTLAKNSGLTRQGVSAILKRGTCEPKTAGKLAIGLGVAIEEIVMQEES